MASLAKGQEGSELERVLARRLSIVEGQGSFFTNVPTPSRSRREEAAEAAAARGRAASVLVSFARHPKADVVDLKPSARATSLQPPVRQERPERQEQPVKKERPVRGDAAASAAAIHRRRQRPFLVAWQQFLLLARQKAEACEEARRAFVTAKAGFHQRSMFTAWRALVQRARFCAQALREVEAKKDEMAKQWRRMLLHSWQGYARHVRRAAQDASAKQVAVAIRGSSRSFRSWRLVCQSSRRFAEVSLRLQREVFGRWHNVAGSARKASRIELAVQAQQAADSLRFQREVIQAWRRFVGSGRQVAVDVEEYNRKMELASQRPPSPPPPDLSDLHGQLHENLREVGRLKEVALSSEQTLRSQSFVEGVLESTVREDQAKAELGSLRGDFDRMLQEAEVVKRELGRARLEIEVERAERELLSKRSSPQPASKAHRPPRLRAPRLESSTQTLQPEEASPKLPKSPGASSVGSSPFSVCNDDALSNSTGSLVLAAGGSISSCTSTTGGASLAVAAGRCMTTGGMASGSDGSPPESLADPRESLARSSVEGRRRLSLGSIEVPVHVVPKILQPGPAAQVHTPRLQTRRMSGGSVTIPLRSPSLSTPSPRGTPVVQRSVSRQEGPCPFRLFAQPASHTISPGKLSATTTSVRIVSMKASPPRPVYNR
mmetsp:Transcript_59879/g.129815  ORF Transcript_59879/g.129815 Transcript_59879/m.129815 type:complete len:662 (-) Transcript_59879:106-2091(-)